MNWEVLSGFQILLVIAAYVAGGILLHWLVKRVLFMAGKKYQPKALHWMFLNNISKIIICVMVVYASMASIPHLQSVSTVFLASSSILVAAVGLASQKTLANAMGGVIISLSKPFAAGDRIRLIRQNVTGFVENVNMMHTIIRTVENNRLLIPNAHVLDDVIENLNYIDTRICHFLDVCITFESNISEAQVIIAEAVARNPLWVDVRTEEDRENGIPAVRVIVRDIAAHRTELRIGVWTQSVMDNFILCSEARKEIVERFRERGIVLYRPLVEWPKQEGL
jgi:small-conductance mechanosensitive channel